MVIRDDNNVTRRIFRVPFWLVPNDGEVLAGEMDRYVYLMRQGSAEPGMGTKRL